MLHDARLRPRRRAPTRDTALRGTQRHHSRAPLGRPARHPPPRRRRHLGHHSHDRRRRPATGQRTASQHPAGHHPASEGRTLDGRGLLALPGIVNAHAHVDKSWWGLPWQSYGGEGGTQGRIAHERARRDELGIPGLDITTRVLAEMVRHGTTAFRSHVDVDLGLGLSGLDIVRDAAASFEGAIELHTVAFPQDGILRRDGVAELLARMGEAGMSMTTVAPLRLPQLPKDELRAAGVRLALGTDGIRDLWSPYGTGDTLGIAWQFARASSLVTDDDLLDVVRLATTDAAWALGRPLPDDDRVPAPGTATTPDTASTSAPTSNAPGFAPGCRADIVLIDAMNPLDALVRTPPREAVIGAGRLLYSRT